MSRKRQFLIIVVAVVTIVSVISHVTVRWLGIRVEAVSPLVFGSTNQTEVAVAAGSSLMFFGVDWQSISRDLDGPIRGFAVAAGSVYEMEVLQRSVPSPRCTFLGIGVFDFNENYISDFRADIVPLGGAVKDLGRVGAPWLHQKRVLSQYPLKYLRALFPTAGRSVHVMAGVREKFRSLLPRGKPVVESSDRAVISSESNSHIDDITTWPDARIRRNLADICANGGNEIRFDGEKHSALMQFLSHAEKEGAVVLVIFPQSQTYHREFITPEVQRQFESVIAESQKQTPGLICVRLDQMPELQSDIFYWDMVHLNAPGQAIATAKLRTVLVESGIIK
jgi:hypothetical protein